ncbi:unnamed protein product [Calypogeia fissa]
MALIREEYKRVEMNSIQADAKGKGKQVVGETNVGIVYGSLSKSKNAINANKMINLNEQMKIDDETSKLMDALHFEIENCNKNKCPTPVVNVQGQEPFEFLHEDEGSSYSTNFEEESHKFKQKVISGGAIDEDNILPMKKLKCNQEDKENRPIPKPKASSVPKMPCVPSFLEVLCVPSVLKVPSVPAVPKVPVAPKDTYSTSFSVQTSTLNDEKKMYWKVHFGEQYILGT